MQDRLELNSAPDTHDRFRSNNLKKLTLKAEFLIHSLTTLPQLLLAKSSKHEEPTLRFLVDLAGKAWFARENQEDLPSPAHYQMTGESQNSAYCKTAGNLEFKDSTCRVLHKINHKSGDFRPSFSSLKWFLAILVLNEPILPFTLPELILIEELDESGGVINAFEFPIQMIRAWGEVQIQDPMLIQRLTDHDPIPKQVCYEPPARPERVSRPQAGSHIRSSLFGSSPQGSKAQSATPRLAADAEEGFISSVAFEID